MPKFLDAHALKGTDEETIKKLQNAPADEFGIGIKVSRADKID